MMSPPNIILEEERKIIEGLKVNSEFLSDHISNYIPLNGKLPEDKSFLLQLLDQEIVHLRKDPGILEHYRQKELLRHL